MPSHRTVFLLITLLPLGFQSRGIAQQPSSGSSATDALLDKTQNTNVLTSSGASSFHAILDITAATPDDPVHRGSVDLMWVDATHYRLQIQSPNFRQLLVVQGESVQEVDEGDFYPTWLQNFANALLQPLAQAESIRGHNDFEDSDRFKDFCIARDERRNNVLDAAAYARICFDKSLNMQLTQVLDYTHSLIFSDFRRFHDKSIAYSYRSSTRDGIDLRGSLRILEDWKSDPALLAVTEPTPASARILTSFVSSSTADGMLQSTPKEPHWPTVREGKLEGNVVLHVVTDRTGKVREASPYESDNEAMRSYGREVALQYQFKPLLINGSPVQIETPLILHFKTTLGIPIPEVDDAWLRANVHCALPLTVKRPASAGKQVEITLRILANGKVSGVQGGDQELAISLLSGTCKFPAISQDGRPSDYVGHLKVIAR